MILRLKNITSTAIKVLILRKDGGIENVLVSSKISFGEKGYKQFIGYLYNDYKIKPLHIILPMRAYVESCDGQTKWMYFLIEDDDLLEKYNTVCDKVSNDTKK